MPYIKVPLLAEEVPQVIDVLPGTASDGSLTAQLLVQSLATTTLVCLDRDSYVKLRDEIDEIFGLAKPALEIVRSISDIPPGPSGPFRA